MLRRLVLSVLLVSVGFVTGLVLTGRLRSAADSRAETVVAPAPAPVPEPQRTAPATAAVVSTGGPDFTRVAGQAVKGVANISSRQVVRTRTSPFPDDDFFRYFF